MQWYVSGLRRSGWEKSPIPFVAPLESVSQDFRIVQFLVLLFVMDAQGYKVGEFFLPLVLYKFEHYGIDIFSVFVNAGQ